METQPAGQRQRPKEREENQTQRRQAAGLTHCGKSQRQEMLIEKMMRDGAGARATEDDKTHHRANGWLAKKRKDDYPSAQVKRGDLHTKKKNRLNSQHTENTEQLLK